MFNSLGAIGNYTAPGAFRGQTFNTYTGGSLFMRAPNKVYQLAAIQFPSARAGCGGIDVFGGSFSHISAAEFKNMLRNITAALPGIAFQLALESVSPLLGGLTKWAKGLDVAKFTRKGGTIWILAVGSDARPGQKVTRTRGDALHLIGFNPSSGYATDISIPRDSYVNIPGHEPHMTKALFKRTRNALLSRYGGRCFICNATADESWPSIRSASPPDRALLCRDDRMGALQVRRAGRRLG